MNRWNDLNEQCEITVNILRPFTDNPLISAYEGIFGKKYDFLSHPISPPGTKVVVYEPSDSRSSWSPHGISGFYLGPALKHYRSVICYIPSTNGVRISDQCDFFPSKFKFPGASTQEMLLNAINKLQNSIDNKEVLTTSIQPVLDQVKMATKVSLKTLFQLNLALQMVYQKKKQCNSNHLSYQHFHLRIQLHKLHLQIVLKTY